MALSSERAASCGDFMLQRSLLVDSSYRCFAAADVVVEWVVDRQKLCVRCASIINYTVLRVGFCSFGYRLRASASH